MGSVEAIWLGGPQDGKAVTIPEGIQLVSVPVMMNYPPWLDEEWTGDMSMESLVIREVRCPVIHDEWGYHIVWHEPS